MPNSLPPEEEDLLADTWMQALDLLAQGDPAAGRHLLRRGVERASDLTAPWQPAALSHWRLALDRYPARRPAGPDHRRAAIDLVDPED